jgi:hypothetical protein
MKKKFYKSKTVDSALVIIVIAILNILGVGEVEIGKTYDTLTETTGHKTESAKDIGLLIGGAGAIYGRYKVKED